MAIALQLVGAVVILVAFVGQQLGRMDGRGRPYLVLNLLGSATLAVLAGQGRDWGFLLLEGTWAIVSAAGLLRRRPAAAAAT